MPHAGRRGYNLAGSAILVAWLHPWWAAEVDGRDTANVLFQAAMVPAGKRSVEFEFLPFSGAVSELRGMVADGR